MHNKYSQVSNCYRTLVACINPYVTFLSFSRETFYNGCKQLHGTKLKVSFHEPFACWRSTSSNPFHLGNKILSILIRAFFLIITIFKNMYSIQMHAFCLPYAIMMRIRIFAFSQNDLWPIVQNFCLMVHLSILLHVWMYTQLSTWADKKKSWLNF